MGNIAYAELSNNLVYSAMGVFTLSFIAFVLDLARKRVDIPEGAVEVRKWAGIGMSLAILGTVLDLAGIVTRALAVQRAPWGNLYEFTLTGTGVVMVVYLVWSRRADLRSLGAFIVGPILSALGLAITVLYVDAGELVPALRSYWLIIHVPVAIIASALLMIGFSLTVIFLVQLRFELRASLSESAKEAKSDAAADDDEPTKAAASTQRTDRDSLGARLMSRLPDSDTLDQLAYRFHIAAFPLWTFTIIAGAIWAENAWNRYWGWDPKETWSFIIWVIFAAYLHARATRGWDGKKAAYLATAGFIALMINMTVVNYLMTGKHSYAG